ncbi:MAG: hemolysin III family protein, partial [Fibrobacter sp.]|nr:hemolysin III family protein [Fibrobacter sp.]
RWLTTSIYLVMGWVAIVAVVPIYKGIELNAFWLLVAGAALYSSGAIIYAIKKPNPFPGALGFHEIFHVLVLLANGTFALMIYKILVTYKAMPR